MNNLQNNTDSLDNLTKTIFYKKVNNIPLNNEESKFDNEILSKLWYLIDISKSNCNFDSKKQYTNLISELNEKSKEEIIELNNLWSKIHTIIINNKNFIGLSYKLRTGGDDSTFMDFGNWIVAQGQQLCLDFLIKGPNAVVDYIATNNISRSNYTFECMAYIFNRILDI